MIHDLNNYGTTKITTTKPQWITPINTATHITSLTHRQYRYPYTKYRSLMWIQQDYPRTIIDKNQKLSPTELHNPLLGIIGILPRTIKQDLKQMGHGEDQINKDNIRKIQNIIKNASIKTYSAYNQR